MNGGTPVERRAFLAAAAGTATAAGYVGQASGSVDRTLQGGSGRVDAVLRLNAGPPNGSSGGPADHIVSELRHDAARSQRSVVDFVQQASGMAVRRQFYLANAVAVSVDTSVASLADLAALDGVDRIHRDGIGADRSRATLDEPERAAPQTGGDVSYGLDMMHVPDVWERFDTRGEGATIAIIDTGVDASHPDIDLTSWAEFDADGQRVDSDPHDPAGHGTGMSSLAVGGDASGTQIGVAPDADLLVAKQDPEGRFTSTLAAIEWAVENGADAISMSFDFGPLEHEGIEAFENAMAAGTVMVPASFGPDLFLSPGGYHSALTAGAVDSERRPYRNGNGGEIRTARYWRSDAVPDDWPDRYVVPDVVSAGVDVLTALPDNDQMDGGHGRNSGFSNGPPHVAGVVALLRSLDESLSPDALARILRATAEQPGEPFAKPDPNGDFGHGIVNAAAAAAEVGGRNSEISGTVAGVEGAPVAGATVSAVTGETAETDTQGRYTLSVPNGEAALTASAVGYEPVSGRVPPGTGRDVTFESERRPDIERAARPPEHVAPGDSISLEFGVNHAHFATVHVDETAVPVDPSAVSVAINGEAATVDEPTEIAGERTVEVDLTVEDGVRGLLGVKVSLADEERNAGISLDPIHVHERPLRVAGDQDLKRAVAVAAPETTVTLADGRWEVPATPTESPLPESRYGTPVTDRTREDAAGLLVDRPIELMAGDGAEPTIVATGVDADSRAFGVQVASHFASLRGVEIVAEGGTAAVSVLDGDGVHLQGLTLSGANSGVQSQLTKSLVVGDSTLAGSEYGVELRDFSVHALVEKNTIRDAETGIFLSGRAGERLFDVDATVADNTFEGVDTELGTAGTATILNRDGTTKQGGGGGPQGGSSLDLLLYGATAMAVGALFYPALRRRLR